MAADGTDLQAMLKNMRISAATARVDRNWIKYGDLGGPFLTSPSSFKDPASVAKFAGIEGYMKAPGPSSRLGSLQANPGLGCGVTLDQLQQVTPAPKLSKVVPKRKLLPDGSSAGGAAGGASAQAAGEYGEDGKWYGEAEWAKWNAQNLANAQAAASQRAASRTPQVQSSGEQPQDEGFQLEVDWTVPIANVQPGFFSTLAASKVEDDAPLLSGSIPRAALNLRYGMM